MSCLATVSSLCVEKTDSFLVRFMRVFLSRNISLIVKNALTAQRREAITPSAAAAAAAAMLMQCPVQNAPDPGAEDPKGHVKDLLGCSWSRNAAKAMLPAIKNMAFVVSSEIEA